MKRINRATIIALAAVAMLATGCKKEQTGKTVTLGASIASNNSKVYIDNLTPKWQVGDPVSVNGTEYNVTGISVSGATANIPNVDKADNYRCVYPSSIVTGSFNGSSTSVAVTMPTTQTYSVSGDNQTVDVPMSGYTSGTTVEFHNLCSVLKVTFTNSTGSSQTLRKIRVTAASALLSGSGTAQVTGAASDKVELSSGEKYVDLDLTGGTNTTGVEVSTGTSKDFYIVLPEFGNQNVTIEIVRMDNMQATVSISNVSLGHNMLVTKTCGFNSAAMFNTRHMPGVFTVGENTKGKFSQGNLRATGTTSSSPNSGWTWSFAEHQYDYIGNAAANTAISGNGTVSANGTVDLFGWSTGNNYYGIGNSSGNYWGAFVNWGQVFGQSSPWRTLTSDEWYYLLGTAPNNNTNYRTTTSGVRYAKATVADVPGLIILPDDWSTSYYTLEYTNTPAANYTTNTISLADWTNNLEAHGAVFLPAAGYRMSGNYVEAICGYWSSTASATSGAYCMYFNSGYVSVASNNPQGGMSVRLVQDL